MPTRLGEALLELDAVTRRLRRECPWDREQDERSIVPHTVEEAYELADAAHARDDEKLLDELGDVLFQVYFLALLLEERGKGDLAAVARGSMSKLVRRHPHVFGDERESLDELPTRARTASEVRENWEAIKRTEGDGESPPAGPPENLPALTYARKVQGRLAGASAWDALSNVARAVGETERVVAATESGPSEHHGSDALYERIGELLFACVELSRAVQVDPEIALRRYADDFRARAGSPSR
jgi:XTP/dITP diphosphohydrolase/tetrapyrrole methylase family protein/MazG family protein/ATP diphosphatase